MKGKITILILLALLFSFSLVSADSLLVTYNLKDGNNNPVGDVDFLIFNCNDADCNSVSIPNFVNGNNKINSNSDGMNSNVKVYYPTNLETPYGYAQYFFKDGYLPMEGFADWRSNAGGQQGFSKDIIFTQKEFCTAEIKSLYVLKTRDIIVNSPLHIQVDVGSDVLAPLIFNPDTPEYVPLNEGFAGFYSSDVKVTAKITDATNTLVFQQPLTKSIFASSSQTYDFVWTPLTQGNYQVTVESTVTDNKCASQISDSESENFDVFVSNFPEVHVLKPMNNEFITGNYEVKWSAFDQGQDVNTLDITIEYKEDNVAALFKELAYKIGVGDGSWTAINDPQGSTDNNDGSLFWNTLTVANGPYQLRVSALDNDNNRGISAVVSFRINNAQAGNNNPVITTNSLPDAVVAVNYQAAIEANDPDGDAIRFSLEGPDGMAINRQTGLITWLPESKHVGNNNVVVTADDGRGGVVATAYLLRVKASGRDDTIPDDKIDLIHEISISNAFAKEGRNFVDVYVQLINRGNQKEDTEVEALVVETGDKSIASATLNLGETDWKILRLKNPGPGKYLIKITAGSDDAKDLKYLQVKL